MADMMAGQIRRLMKRVESEREKMNAERLRLEYGIGRVNERIADLARDAALCADMTARLKGALACAEGHPRGWKGNTPDPDGFPKYNSHRRLAVMGRSFL
jgi:hypothetical protein